MKKVESQSRWYVVRTNPNSETRAAKSLSRAGYGPYVPMWKREKFNGRKREWVMRERPLMTGYLFVEMPYGEPDWYTLRRCNGVKGVLGVTDARGETKPFPVPSRLVERVMTAQLNLMFDDTRAAMAKRDEQAESLYRPGAQVMVTKGPFARFPATVDMVRPNGTISSLIAIFGRMTVVELAPDQVELEAA